MRCAGDGSACRRGRAADFACRFVAGSGQCTGVRVCDVLVVPREHAVELLVIAPFEKRHAIYRRVAWRRSVDRPGVVPRSGSGSGAVDRHRDGRLHCNAADVRHASPLDLSLEHRRMAQMGHVSRCSTMPVSRPLGARGTMPSIHLCNVLDASVHASHKRVSHTTIK